MHNSFKEFIHSKLNHKCIQSPLATYDHHNVVEYTQRNNLNTVKVATKYTLDYTQEDFDKQIIT